VEFVLTNEEGLWDNAPGGANNYVAPSPGQYKLHHSDLVLLPPNVPCLLVRLGRKGGEWRHLQQLLCLLGLASAARSAV
jgi:hypothetical protein